MYEFQFRWGGKTRAFGIDVNADTLEEAVTKANAYFDSDDLLTPQSTQIERAWILVTKPVTARDIRTIFDSETHLTVAEFRRLRSPRGNEGDSASSRRRLRR